MARNKLNKQRLRRDVDIAMTALLPMLMAYSLIGETFHEIVGTLMFALFIAHHSLNRGYYKALLRGRYTARRAFQTVVNVLLLLFMVAQPVSGILMSKHLYTFIGIPGAASRAREIHLCLAYWGFMLMCVHAGTHLTAPLMRLKRRRGRAFLLTMGALSAASLYGCYAVRRRQLADNMFMKSAFTFFDYSEPLPFFILDYAAMMVLFGFVGFLITWGLSRVERQK